MKKIIAILLSVCCLGMAGCQAPAETSSSGPVQEETPAVPEETEQTSVQPEETAEKTGSDTLIVYFSRAGENYNVGIVEKGNTRIVAEKIAEETGYDLFEIETVKEYPVSYDEMLDVSTEEKNNNERPELKTAVENFDSYSRIIFGYPIWWGDMPMAVYTFLESYDFTGKTIYPFDTHGGSGLAGTVNSIREVTGTEVMEGLAIAGTTAQNDPDETEKAVRQWLQESGLYPEN